MIVFLLDAVDGVGETTVHADVPDGSGGEEENHDPGHPSERYDSGQKSTGGIFVAPVEFSPLLSGNGGANCPQGEEEQEPSHFGTKRRHKASLMPTVDSNEPV